MTATKTAGRWANWSGTVSGTPLQVAYPSHENEIGELLTDRRLRASGFSAIGSGHSYVALAAPSGRTLIDLRNIAGVVAEDHESSTVTVGAGTTLRDLNEMLARRGLALPNQSAIDVQTVAGALATATHGSSPRRGSLSSHLSGLRLVTADGKVRQLNSADPYFDAVRVHLGCLGVVSAVTLDVVPAFVLRKVVKRQPLHRVLGEIPSLLNAEFAGFWWYPHTSHVMVWRAERVQRAEGSGRRRNDVVPARVVAAASRRSRAVAGPVNALAAWLACRGGAAPAARSDAALVTGVPPRQQSMEYSVPVGIAAEALRELQTTLRKHDVRITSPIDVRFTGADSAWLSPSHGRETCHIGLSAYLPRPGCSEWKTDFPVIDSVLAAHEGRPHWAKVHFRRPDQLERSYPRWSDFHRVRRRLDPDRVFLTDYLRSLFGDVE